MRVCVPLLEFTQISHLYVPVTALTDVNGYLAQESNSAAHVYAVMMGRVIQLTSAIQFLVIALRQYD
jgi:hypothetical protein